MCRAEIRNGGGGKQTLLESWGFLGSAKSLRAAQDEGADSFTRALRQAGVSRAFICRILQKLQLLRSGCLFFLSSHLSVLPCLYFFHFLAYLPTLSAPIGSNRGPKLPV